MARIRTIKPEFFRHFELFEAERETELPLRLAFIGLWTVCDREGRFKWRPEMLKVECLPYDQVDFLAILNELNRFHFIEKYEHEGRFYGFVPSFNQHQAINTREANSALPTPVNILHVHACEKQVNAQWEKEGKGKEGVIRNESLEKEYEGKPFTESNDSGGDNDFYEILETEEKEKKVPPKKRKEGSTEFFNGAKELFLQFFQEQNNTAYYFSAKDAAAIKGIEKQIEQQIKDKGIAVLNEDSKLAGFRHFLKIAWLNGGDWLKANFSLSILNSKFSLIVSNYNNQRNGQSKTEQQLNDDRRNSRHALNDLAEKIVFSFNS